MYEPKRFPIIHFIIGIIIVVAGIGIYVRLARPAEPEPITVAVTETKPTATIRPTASPTPINTPIPLPSTTPAPELRFGVVAREDGCVIYNDIVVTILEEQNVYVGVVEFADADSLYEALATQAVDLTLCFQDPTDRPYLTLHVGFLKTLSSPYFDNGQLRLQVMLNAANIVPFRESKPCLVQLLQSMRFGEAEEISAEDWIVNNESAVTQWTDCQPQQGNLAN